MFQILAYSPLSLYEWLSHILHLYKFQILGLQHIFSTFIGKIGGAGNFCLQKLNCR